MALHKHNPQQREALSALSNTHPRAQQRPPGIDAAELRRRRGEGGRNAASRNLFSKRNPADSRKPVVKRFRAKEKDPMLLPKAPKRGKGGRFL